MSASERRFRFAEEARAQLRKVYAKRCAPDVAEALIRELEVVVHVHLTRKPDAAAILAEARGRGRPPELWRQQLVDDILVIVEGHVGGEPVAATARIVLQAIGLRVDDYRPMLRKARDPQRRAARRRANRSLFRGALLSRNKNPPLTE
jgi:hypothetical protein